MTLTPTTRPKSARATAGHAKPTELSFRTHLRRWILEEAKDEAEVSLPDLAAKALAKFGKDQGFIQSLLAETLPSIVYSEAQRALGGLRRLGDDLVSPEARDKRATRVASRWERWFEHVGAGHVLVMDMSRSQLLEAASLRRGQAQPHLEIATLFETLAGGMQPGDEMVRDRFSAEEIERVRLSLLPQAVAS